MLERAYIEITNICNRACSFCPGCAREPGVMAPEDFALYAGRLRAHTDRFYLHVMGEPTLHPHLDEILAICDRLSARVTLTTNGTLLREKRAVLFSHGCLGKVQISLHSFEANPNGDRAYFEDCFSFARAASDRGIIVILRLWNENGREKGENAHNGEILERARAALPGFWTENKRGYCIAPKLYLEYDERFAWPGKGKPILHEGGYCRALKDQIAVLVDGTVVPCCLDGQGAMPLGNLKSETLEQILNGETAGRMRAAFERRGRFENEFCRTCGYIDRFVEKTEKKY